MRGKALGKETRENQTRISKRGYLNTPENRGRASQVTGGHSAKVRRFSSRFSSCFIVFALLLRSIPLSSPTLPHWAEVTTHRPSRWRPPRAQFGPPPRFPAESRGPMVSIQRWFEPVSPPYPRPCRAAMIDLSFEIRDSLHIFPALKALLSGTD